MVGKASRTASRVAVPGFAWMAKSPVRWLVFGFGSGLLRPAPGTWGTLFAWVAWVALLQRFSDPSIAVVLVLSFAVGCWACQQVGRELGRPDDGAMVWDEVVAFWLVLWLTPPTLAMQALAFLLFRVFDITKPPPIRYFDARLKNGFGVMWDDLLAAGYTVLSLAVLFRLKDLLL